jgi:hypothetical protein
MTGDPLKSLVKIAIEGLKLDPRLALCITGDEPQVVLDAAKVAICGLLKETKERAENLRVFSGESESDLYATELCESHIIVLEHKLSLVTANLPSNVVPIRFYSV